MKLIQLPGPVLFSSTLFLVAGIGSAQGTNDSLIPFFAGSVARAADVNANFQTVMGRAVEATTLANAAGSEASDARVQASSAMGRANEALSTANGVQGLASSASTTAANAMSRADDALGLAGSVEGLADSAKSTAEAAQSDVAQLSSDALPLLSAIAVDGMNNVGIGMGVTFGAAQNELLQLGDFLSPQDNYMEIRTVGGSTNLHQGIKLRSSNPGYGFTIEHSDVLGALNIIRHESDSVGRSALYIDRLNGNVGLGTETPSERLQVIGNICATGFIGACSDRRFKQDIQPLESALETIQELRGVSYDWRTEEFPEHAFTTDRQVGFIAQEVAEVLPHMVSEGSDGYYSVDYGKLTPVLVEAVKEQQSEIEALRLEVEALRNDLGGMLQLQDELLQVRQLLGELAAGR